MKTRKNPFEKFKSKDKIELNDCGEFEEKLKSLLVVDTSSKESLLTFFEKLDDIEKLFFNDMHEAYFLNVSDVSNQDYKTRYDFISQELYPVYERYREKIDQKIIKSSAIDELGGRYLTLKRNITSYLETFHQDNLEINKEIDKICSEITEIQGRLTAKWDGEDQPLTMIYPHMKSTNREERKKAHDVVDKANLSVFQEIDQRFDRLLNLRLKAAKNAGFESFTDYQFKKMQRLDWSKEDCFEFHKAVKKHIVPLARKLAEQKRQNLGLSELKYYDSSVDFKGREPVYIYNKDDVLPFIEGTGKIINSIDSELYSFFKTIKDNDLLDLEARKNKGPGGFMCSYPAYEMASVFYGGSGLANDLFVLLHELGHCFHYFLSKNITPYSLLEFSPEIAEAGSMSMEYIGLEHLEEYLDAEVCERLREGKLRSVVGLLIDCAMVDEFQHWVYENPGHSSPNRQDKWKELLKIYSPEINCEGREDIISKIDWQFIHILQMPFYFIDYAISELLALSVWDRYKKDKVDGLRHYKEGCSLAGSKSVPETYKTFGTKLDFSEKVIEPLAQRLQRELGMN